MTLACRVVRRSGSAPEERSAVLIGLANCLRDQLELHEAPMASARGIATALMNPGSDFEEVLTRSQSTVNRPSQRIPTNTLRFAFGAPWVGSKGNVSWSQLANIEHPWGLDIRLILTTVPSELRKVVETLCLAVGAQRAWVDGDEEVAFGAGTRFGAWTWVGEDDAIPRAARVVGGMVGRWLLAHDGSPDSQQLDHREAVLALHAQGRGVQSGQVAIPARPESASGPANVALAHLLPSYALPRAVQVMVPPVASPAIPTVPAGPPKASLVSTALSTGPLVGATPLPFIVGAPPKEVQPSLPSEPAAPRPKQSLPSGTLAPSAQRGRSMPFVRDAHAAPVKIELGDVDLSLFPIERYAEITGALAQGHSRGEVLAKYHMSDEVFSLLGRAWSLRFEKEPELLARYRELARRSMSRGR